MSIFATTGLPPAEAPETPPETNDTPDIPETPETSVIRMPDGTKKSIDAYIEGRIQQAQQRHVPTETAPETAPETVPHSPLRVSVEEDAFQSDVEKELVEKHNTLVASVEATEAQRRVDDTQRQIETIERTKGVSESELMAVYNEFGGEVKNLDALAEVALARKSTAEQSEARTREANANRQSFTSRISGGGHAITTSSGNDQPKGRGLSGKAIYDGAAIAAKYSR